MQLKQGCWMAPCGAGLQQHQLGLQVRDWLLVLWWSASEEGQGTASRAKVCKAKI